VLAGPQRSRNAAQKLKTAGFLDKQTKTLSVKFASMHTSTALFSFVRIDMILNSAGVFSDKFVDIQSVRLEPYVLGSNFSDRLLLAGEVQCYPHILFIVLHHNVNCILVSRSFSWFGLANFSLILSGRTASRCWPAV
jgi:hypothetical protein